jgi:hypothetical protein
VRPDDSGEVELGTALIRRFLDIRDGERQELTFFARGRLSIAHVTSEAEQVRLLKEAERIRGFNGAYQLVNGPIESGVFHRYPLDRICPAWNGRASDANVCFRRATFIDIDPIRPKGISATEAEKVAAIDVCHAVEQFLIGALGVPSALAHGDSGNGCFILVATEPCISTPEATLRVNRFLKLLAREFNTDRVQIDTSVGNAARLMPCPGTWKRNGEDTVERPHRRVYFSCRPNVHRIPLESIVG